MASPSDAFGRVTPFETGRVTGLTTGTGTAYTRIDLTFAAQKCIVLVPDEVADRTDVTLVLHSHGLADDEAHVVATRMMGTTEGMLDRGWVVTSHFMHGNSWGSPQAMHDLKDVYHWAAHKWHVKHVVLHGFSMGGMATLNALGNKVVPDIVASITVNGVVDIATNWPDQAMAVYGGMTIAEALGYMAEKQSDPRRDNPLKWANDPIYMIGGTNDTVVPPADHMVPFIARAATPAMIHYQQGTHGHLQGFMPELCLPWADDYAPNYATQTPYGAPTPNWPLPPEPEPEDPGTGGGSGLFTTGGAQVSLYTTSGSLVQATPA